MVRGWYGLPRWGRGLEGAEGVDALTGAWEGRGVEQPTSRREAATRAGTQRMSMQSP